MLGSISVGFESKHSTFTEYKLFGLESECIFAIGFFERW